MTEPRQNAGYQRLVDEMRRQLYELQQDVSEIRSDIRALQVQADNRQARDARTPTWLFGVITALVGLISVMVNVWAVWGR